MSRSHNKNDVRPCAYGVNCLTQRNHLDAIRNGSYIARCPDAHTDQENSVIFNRIKNEKDYF